MPGSSTVSTVLSAALDPLRGHRMRQAAERMAYPKVAGYCKAGSRSSRKALTLVGDVGALTPGFKHGLLIPDYSWAAGSLAAQNLQAGWGPTSPAKRVQFSAT